MSYRSLRVVALFCCSLFFSTAIVAFAQKPAADGKSDSKDVLFKADRDFFAAVQARKLDGWMEFMTEETTISRDKPYSGLAAIRAAVAEDYKDPGFQLTWDPESGAMMESGKLGYTSGHFVAVVPGPDKKPVKFGGQYLTVWKKQKDGSWKVLWDGGSSTGPVK